MYKWCKVFIFYLFKHYCLEIKSFFRISIFFFLSFFFIIRKPRLSALSCNIILLQKTFLVFFLIKSPHNGDGILPHFTFTLHVHDSAHHQYSHKQKVTFILAPFLIKNVDDKLPKQHYKSNSDKCTQGAHSI